MQLCPRSRLASLFLWKLNKARTDHWVAILGSILDHFHAYFYLVARVVEAAIKRREDAWTGNIR